MKRVNRWARLLFCAALFCALLPTTAAARGVIDTDRSLSLTLNYPCSGIEFQIYYVAEVSAYGEYTLTGDFRNDPVTLDQPDQAGWRALAATLDGYVARDQRQPLATGITDSNGQVVFYGLERGMYLVTWQKHTTDGYTYTPEPFLVCVPGLDEVDEWIYDVTAAPKYDREKEPDQPGDETVRRRVLKVWKDNGDKTNRPKTVTVLLLRNGEVYDRVILSEANNWSYIWDDLNKEDTWQVVEIDVAGDYTVTVSREGITFVVTNTLSEEIPDEPPPSDLPPREPDEDIPDETPPQGPVLPQTGVLWWPVPVLACCGMTLFLVGWIKRQKEERDEA